MKYIQQEFNIKDLEMLSGIKAHTIRIWEKRYGVLSPDRTETNIRIYDTETLQKLLNIAFLNRSGYKISRIAKLNPQEIRTLVKAISTVNNAEEWTREAFKMATINFNETLFLKTYDRLAAEHSFSDIFKNAIIPFLAEIGVLWQTHTINPAQEHFISHLIRLKLLSNIEKQQAKVVHKNKVFILFLPENEIHDLGLLFAQYELMKNGYKTIYLGHSLPVDDLCYFEKNLPAEKINFVSHLTVKPENLKDYLQEFEQKVLKRIDCNYLLLGNKAKDLAQFKLPENIQYFDSINALIYNS